MAAGAAAGEARLDGRTYGGGLHAVVVRADQAHGAPEVQRGEEEGEDRLQGLWRQPLRQLRQGAVRVRRRSRWRAVEKGGAVR